jgi:maltoporin
MEVTFVDGSEANIELTDQEITTIHNIFTVVKQDLDHEPEFQTRVGVDYTMAQELIESLSNNCIVDRSQVTLINNLFNEVCTGLKIKDFDNSIGIPKVEAKSYLRAFNKLANVLQ